MPYQIDDTLERCLVIAYKSNNSGAPDRSAGHVRQALSSRSFSHCFGSFVFLRWVGGDFFFFGDFLSSMHNTVGYLIHKEMLPSLEECDMAD